MKLKRPSWCKRATRIQRKGEWGFTWTKGLHPHIANPWLDGFKLELEADMCSYAIEYANQEDCWPRFDKPRLRGDYDGSS